MRKIITIILIFCMVFIPTYSIAAKAEEQKVDTISINDAYLMALSNSYDIAKNNKALYELLKYYGLAKSQNNIAQFDMEVEFNRLYQKLQQGTFLQSYEQGELLMYYAIFNESDYFRNKSLLPAINPYDFPNCGVWVNMMQIKMSSEIKRKSIIFSVKQLYDSLINLNDNINILNESIKITEDECKVANLNYKSGKITEMQKIRLEKQYEIQKLELKKIKRTKENTERNFKRLLGIDISKNIQVSAYEVSNEDITMPDYDYSISEALLNRNEVAMTKMELLSTQNELTNLDKYFWYLPNDEGLQMTREELLLRINELKNSVNENKNTVLKDINTKYSEAEYQLKTFEIEKNKFISAENELNNARMEYERNKLSLKSLLEKQINYLKVKSNFESSKRELASKITKIKYAYGV